MALINNRALMVTTILSGKPIIIVTEQIANQPFGYGLLSADQAGAFTVVPTSGTVTSIVIDGASLGSASDFETSGATIRTSVGNTFTSNTTLNCTATFADTSTETFDAVITADANEYSVASDAEYRTVLAIATATLSGKTLRIRDGVTITPVDADYLTRVFSSVFTIAAYPDALVIIDEEILIDTVTNFTIDGQIAVVGGVPISRIKFNPPNADGKRGIFLDTVTDMVIQGCEFTSQFGALDPDGDYRPRLDYTGETGAFTVGQNVTGATSGKSVAIVGVIDNGTTGTLILDGADPDINDTGEEFTSGEAITDPLGGAAVVDVASATLYRATTLINNVNAVTIQHGVVSTRITFQDNYVHDLSNGVGLAGLGDLIIRGNYFKNNYTDSVQINRETYGDSTVILDQNVFEGSISNSKDFRNPHTDATQFLDILQNTGTWDGGRVTMNRIIDSHVDSLFLPGRSEGIFSNLTGGSMNGWVVEGNMVIVDDTHGLTLDRIEGSLIGFNTCVLQEGATLSYGMKIDLDETSTEGNLVYNNLADAVSFSSISTGISNVIMGISGAALTPDGDYGDKFPGDGEPTPGFYVNDGAELVTFFTPTSGTEGALEVAVFDTNIPGHAGTLDETKRPAPLIVTLSPADNGTDIAVGVAPTATFDQPIAFGTGNVSVFNASGDVLIEAFNVATEQGTGAGQIELSGNKFICHMTSTFTNGVSVYVQVDATAIDGTLSSKSFAGISDKTTWNFTVVTSAFITFLGSFFSNANATSYTFDADAAFGSVAAGEIILAPVSRGGTAHTISTITVDAASASAVSGAATASSFSHTAHWQYTHSGGSLNDIVVTPTASTSRLGIGVYLVDDANTTVNGTDNAAPGDGTSEIMTLDIAANGGAIATVGHTTTAEGATWTNAAENYDVAFEIRHTSAVRNITTAETATDITATWDNTVSNIRMVGSSWTPN